MEWLLDNWFWVLIGVLFVAMHLSGHCGSGRHGSTDKSSGHRH